MTLGKNKSVGCSVALVGPDGSGKTTIAQRLTQEFPHDVMYMYMGIKAEASNVALPTTRAVERAKRWLGHRTLSVIKRSGLWSLLRVSNRIADEMYRYLLSRWHQRKGRVVIYDRYYKFDFAMGGREMPHSLEQRIHQKWLSALYPDPDLVIFLAAPPSTLFTRKGEGTIEWLKDRQDAIVREGKKVKNFVQVDTSRPIEQVYAEVETLILTFLRRRDRESTAVARAGACE